MDKYFTSDGSIRKRFYILYWISYVLLFTLVQSIPSEDFPKPLYNEIISLFPKMVFVYVITGWLMDKFFLSGKRKIFVTAYVVCLLLFAVALRLIDNYIILHYILTSWTKQPLLDVPPFLYNVVKLQFVVTIPFCLKLFYHWAKENSKVQQVEAEKVKAELDALRHQFHPHFLFNVLNSLYAKILEGSASSAELVLKISSLLRYSVYEFRDNLIELQTEVDYLKDYIDLQKVRFDDKLEVSFAVNGDIAGKKIQPFLIQPFVENSFKYSMNDEVNNGWITISLSAGEEWLTVKVENSKPVEITQKANTIKNNSMAGLSNLKKRLKLLYPNENVLKIIDNDDSFFVSLKLKLYA
jgi:two-component system LytT family sensor kinase